VDLDTDTSESVAGPYYRIESNTQDNSTIQLGAGHNLNSEDFIGKEFTGVQLYKQLKVTGGATVDFGNDRVFVEDIAGSLWDADSDIIYGAGSELPAQQP
jgi:hypothetical protein